jgi:hypothetical protein
MFERGAWDVSLMVGRVFPYVNVMLHKSRETWKSDHTLPRVDCTTDQIGAGFSYDIPWGGGSLETRFEHLEYRSKFVPANDYDGEQLFAKFKLRF